MTTSLAFLVCTTYLLCVSATVHNTASELECQSSGYCSVGKLQSFSGDVSSTAGLQTALTARSYKNEVIISIFTARHMQGALQFYNTMRQQGLSNLLLLSTNATTCGLLLRVLPELGCAWSTAALKSMTGFQQLWHLRIAIAARAVRLGYNVMVADTDIVFFRDPYTFLKQPPFRDTQFLTHREPTHPWGLNCGLYYVQNARPDGPVAWLLAEVADRQLRWLEDGGAFLRGLGLDEHCMTWDQELFDIAFGSAVIGRPVLGVSSLKQCVTQPLSPGQEATTEDVLMQLKQLARRNVVLFKRFILQHGRRVLLPVPPAWSSVLGGNATIWTSASLRLPHAGSPPVMGDLGGSVYPGQRGAASSAFVQQLREAGSGPMWPDPEDPQQAEAAASAAPETFALLPDWFVFGWRHRGRQGYWEARASGTPVQQVLGHMLYVRVTPNAVAKHQLMRYLGHWNWTLHAMHKGDQLYVASTPRTPLPRLLAYHPQALGLDSVSSHHQLQKLMRGLMQAAVASGRAVLWPDLPCSTSLQWDVDDAGGPPTHGLPLAYSSWLHPYGPDLAALRCFNISYASGPCLFRGAGVTQIEFFHMVEEHVKAHGVSSAAQLQPGRHNTVHLSNVVLEALAIHRGVARQRHLLRTRTHTQATRTAETLDRPVAAHGAGQARSLHASQMALGLVNPDEWPELRPHLGAAVNHEALLQRSSAMRGALAGSFGIGGEYDEGPATVDGSVEQVGHVASRHGTSLGNAGSASSVSRAIKRTSVRRFGDALHLGAKEFAQALHLAGVAEQEVVYLSHPVSVDLGAVPLMAAQYQHIQDGCEFLKHA